MKDHSSNHNYSHEYACETCESVFSTIPSIDDHMRSSHQKQSSEQSIFCLSSIPQYDGLDISISSWCTLNEEKSFTSPDENSYTNPDQNPTLEDSWFSQSDSVIHKEAMNFPQKIPVHISSRPKPFPPIKTEARQQTTTSLSKGITGYSMLFLFLSFQSTTCAPFGPNYPALRKTWRSGKLTFQFFRRCGKRKRIPNIKQKLKKYLK